MSKQKIATLSVIVLTNILVGVLSNVCLNRFEFQNTALFWGMLIVPLLSIHYFFTQRLSHGEVKISDGNILDNMNTSWKAYAMHTMFALKMIGISLLIVALARPQSSLSYEDLTKEGIDIVLALDVSHSMMAQDFKPSRLGSAKKVAAKFIDDRPDDRIGLVVYEGESFTQVPITTDHRVLKNGLRDIQPGWIEGGTAIGMGLATAVNRLKESKAKSKIIILLTDGVNNAGQIKPVDAAHIAKAFDIRVYTIGVGTLGLAKTPVRIFEDGSYMYDYVQVEIDEDVLKKIAQTTNGEYFRATSESKLEDIYEEIDKLERTKFNVTKYSNKTEEFFDFSLLGLIFLLFEFALRNTLFRTTP